ncbi:Panacea domain-containing protein [Vibrio ordalii]|uniref:Panacea domain-containing protein n=1 Tax=Vibrio ordalii TaxID=28174 RepID=UPI002577D4C4|nr:Panacea domain-containing protein [Vibrio ordalii]MCS0351186.1 Panacea domain-containing protein [Vibrio ordalii]
MNKIQSLVAYLCMNYPYESELSKERLTKLVYLADWISALVDDKQITRIDWLFNHYGPYVDDVVESVLFNTDFSIVSEQTMYGSEKNIISFHGASSNIELTSREKQIVDAVINKTEKMYFNDFIDYVYSTYPVRSQNRYSHLDLVQLAREYKEIQ